MFELKEIDTVSGVASPLEGKYTTLEGALEWAHHHADKWTEDEATDFEELELSEVESAPMDEIDIPETDMGHDNAASAAERSEIPEDIRVELRSVLGYMDRLLESLPEEKIAEFAQSEHFEVYKKLFEELGLET